MTGSAGPGRPVQLVVCNAARGHLDQHIPEHRGGIRRFLIDKPADAGWFAKADGLHRRFLSRPSVGAFPAGEPSAAPTAMGCEPASGEVSRYRISSTRSANFQPSGARW
jgi:hypothetical protein